jgi:glutamate dehydrogenase/leucine dehydrogenase
MSDLARLTPSAFRDLLVDEGIRAFYLIWDTASRRVIPSHERLAPLAALLEGDERDFDGHEGVFVQVAPGTKALQGAFVHRTCRGQGAGGVRFWSYETVEEYLRDGLRLARGMTHKNALAALWWGGGKGVMARGTAANEADPEVRRAIYAEYGRFISTLRGAYVTAEDVGTSVDDMRAVFSGTRFTTCIPEELGGSGNPSVPTALGVVRGMEAALTHLGLGELEGKTIAIQGLGHVGEPLARFLAERRVGRIVGTDIDPARVEALRAALPGHALDLQVVERGDDSVLAAEADVVAPCATGGTLNPRTIPSIRARVVCGAANNQLEDPERDDLTLGEQGVTYVPDFLVNRMGIVNCADEDSGSIDDDPRVQRHLGYHWDDGVYKLTVDVLRRAEEESTTPHRIALALAESRSLEHHPIWGHRGRQIIDGLRTSWSLLR